MNQVDRIGAFRGRAYEWGLKEYDSGAVALVVGYEVSAERMPADDGSGYEWTAWPDGYAVHGYHFIVTKEGKANQNTVEQMVRYLGWDGDVESVVGGEPPDRLVTFEVEESEYQGKVSYRVSWLHGADWDGGGPGISGAVDAAGAKALAGKYGYLLRAAASVAQGPGGAQGKGGARGAASSASKPKPSAPPPPRLKEEGIGTETPF